MAAPPPSPRPTSPPSPAAADLAEQFEKAWQTGAAPSIRDFLQAARQPDGAQATLIELIMIDLDQRWRRAATPQATFSDAFGATPRLETYVAHFPELGRLDQLPIELIREEFWVRNWWGDRPEVEEYAHRFPQHGQPLLAELEKARREMTAEAPTLANHPPPPPPAADLLPVAQPAAVTSAAEFLSAVLAHQLLSPAQARELAAEIAPRHGTITSLAQELIQRGWLTAYQVNHVVRGAADSLTLGSYLLIERVGEGGTGTVFKARHRGLNRLAAVKVLRRELLADAEVLSRFYREMQVFSRLSHPHVIHAYDAGPVGGAHVLVMEYAPGVDLHRMVKSSGPLRLDQALEYIRQAALGLQHIHEHGLVHRDIKPSNLLVGGLPGGATELNTPMDTPIQPLGSVKIVDLGLARLRRVASGLPAQGGITEEWTATLTPLGAACMGTPDYLSPEQALDFHAADIRADLYSLGCTWFYLLTGRPPFPGGSIAQKLMRHLNSMPEDVCTVRADVPAWMGAVIGRLLEKDPTRRYQTPAELIQALAETGPPAAVPAAPSSSAAPPPVFRSSARRSKAGRNAWLVGGLLALVVGASVVTWAALRTLPPPASAVASERPAKPDKPPTVVAASLPEAPAAYLGDLQQVAGGLWETDAGKHFGRHGELGYEEGKIKVKGVLSPHGISFHPPEQGSAWVAFRLQRKYRTFLGTAAINDTVKASHVPVVFQIYGDDRALWKSRPHQVREDPEEFRIDVTGVDVLKLEVVCPGLNHGAHAVWLEPRLFTVPASGVVAPAPTQPRD